jgi:hypothetical protein
MGYRSEVILAVAPEAASAFMALCAKNPKVLEFCHEADEFKSGYAQEGDWLMYWSGIKWYESFPEIEALSAFIEMMGSDNLADYGEPSRPKRDDGSDAQWGEYFKFLRIGEDANDVEQYGWGFEADIGVQRSICF